MPIVVIYRVYSICCRVYCSVTWQFKVLQSTFGLGLGLGLGFGPVVLSLRCTFLAFLEIRASQFDTTTFHLGNCSAHYVMGLFCFFLFFLAFEYSAVVAG